MYIYICIYIYVYIYIYIYIYVYTDEYNADNAPTVKRVAGILKIGLEDEDEEGI
jgi:hypothetical protein